MVNSIEALKAVFFSHEGHPFFTLYLGHTKSQGNKSMSNQTVGDMEGGWELLESHLSLVAPDGGSFYLIQFEKPGTTSGRNTKIRLPKTNSTTGIAGTPGAGIHGYTFPQIIDMKLKVQELERDKRDLKAELKAKEEKEGVAGVLQDKLREVDINPLVNALVNKFVAPAPAQTRVAMQGIPDAEDAEVEQFSLSENVQSVIEQLYDRLGEEEFEKFFGFLGKNIEMILPYYQQYKPKDDTNSE